MFIFLCACSKKDEHVMPKTDEINFTIPSGFDAIKYPSDNEYSFERWLLGKKLFYDKRLSKTVSVSCASCHQLNFAMADNKKFSIGIEERIGTRNTPSLANIAYHPYFTRDGGVPTLEMQVLVPIQEHNEFDFNIVDIEERLKNDEPYLAQSMAAYNKPLDYYVITRALANFERTILSGNSNYDHYLSGKYTLSESEKNGLYLFNSNKTNCNKCHSGFNFTNYAFENNGLYIDYKDVGRMRLTNKREDLAKFKVASLRNVALTPPYMHDGSINTLAEVINHYNKGGSGHSNQNPSIKPLGLTPKEINDLVAFLEILTDYQFIKNKLLLNEK